MARDTRSVRATTALSLRGTDRRGQRQETARQVPGPHLETQFGERLGGDLIPSHGQSGSRVIASLLRVALGAARPASTGLVLVPVPPVLLSEMPRLRASPPCDC